MFSQFFFRFTGNVSSIIDVNDRDYQLAFIEANVCSHFIIKQL